MASAERVTGAAPLAEAMAIAATVWQRFIAGQSLERALEATAPRGDGLRGAVQALAYAAVRRRALSARLIARLAHRPPADEIAALLAVALPQLIEARHAPYTVVYQAVRAARAAPSTAPAAGFVNALLRNFLRQQSMLLSEFEADDEVRYNAPRWWIEALRAADAAAADETLAAQTEHPPLVVRVDTHRTSVAAFIAQCADIGAPAVQVGAQAVWLQTPRPVGEIPGFTRGVVSVQDAGAQLAAPWLGAAPGMRVLDACAAPGGKTTHLAEAGDLDLVALELDAARARRIEQNLERTGARAQLLVGDAATPASWWDGRPFDCVLLDAPCTASGIVRRHPDIPWLRRPADVAQLTTLQGQMLEALWPLLGPGGRLLYVVCSVFPEEGSGQVERFIRRHTDVKPVPLPVGASSITMRPTRIPEPAPTWDRHTSLPTLHDGFFYALLEKSR